MVHFVLYIVDKTILSYHKEVKIKSFWQNIAKW